MEMLSKSKNKKVYKIGNIVYKQFFDLDLFYMELYIYNNLKLKEFIPELLFFDKNNLLIATKYIKNLSDKISKSKKCFLVGKLLKEVHSKVELSYYKFLNDDNKIYFKNQIMLRINYVYNKKNIDLIKLKDSYVINKYDNKITLNINDLQFKNFLFTRDKAYFCDFELFEFGSPYMGIADFFTSNYLSEFDKKIFFRGYVLKVDTKILSIYTKYLYINNCNIENKNKYKYKYIDYLIPINNICNQSCNFCSAEYRMKTNKEIPLKIIFKQILEKDNYIQISGGEPLLSKNLYKILYFIRKNKPNCFIEFQTNGVYLLENNNLNKLEKFNIGLYNINYPCHIETVNDKIVGVKGTFKKREQAMKEVIKRGLKLRINIIVNTINYKYLGELVEYINNNFKGLERIQFSFTKAMGAADKNDEVVPKYEDTEIYFIEALEKCEKYFIKVDIDHIPMCFLGKFYKHHVDYKKKLLGEKGVYLKEKNYVEKCNTCDKKDLCSGYRKDYLKIYNIKNGEK